MLYRVCKLHPTNLAASVAGRKPWELTYREPTLRVRRGEQLLLCGPGSVRAWPVAAVAVAVSTTRVAMANFESAMASELRALLPDERAAVNALVDKWSCPTKARPRTYMYLTHFSAVHSLQRPVDLHDEQLGVRPPYHRACSALPVLPGSLDILQSHLYRAGVGADAR